MDFLKCTTTRQLCQNRTYLLSPEKLKALYSFVDAARHVDYNKEGNEHDDARDICWYFRSNDSNNTHTLL